MSELGYQSLDDILNCIKVMHDTDGYVWILIHRLVNKIETENLEIYLDQYQIGQVFRKLVRDGYLETEKQPYTQLGQVIIMDWYRLTFEGELLIKNGGYLVKNENENQDRILTRRMSWAVAVGTVLAGIYGVIEVVKILVRFLDWTFACQGKP